MRKNCWQCLMLLLTLLFIATILPAQDAQVVATLERTKPLERELHARQTHSYKISLKAGQYLHLVVEQKGIDVLVTVFSPDYKKLKEIDSPNGTLGPENLLLVAGTTGSYQLDVRALEPTAAAGHYEIKIKDLRTATVQDQSRVAAEEVSIEAEQLRRQGTAESLRKAIEKFKESLRLIKVAGDSSAQAATFTILGGIHDALGERSQALEAYKQALSINKAAGMKAAEANSLNDIGSVYEAIGDAPKALDYYSQAISILRTVDSRQSLAYVLTNLGSVHEKLGERKKAIEVKLEALQILRAIGDRPVEALVLENIGVNYDLTGEKAIALDYFMQSNRLWRSLGKRFEEGVNLNNIATVYKGLNQPEKALEFYNASLSAIRATENRSMEALILDNMAQLYAELGQSQKAFDSYARALQLSKISGDRKRTAKLLNNIGGDYRNLGEYQKALDHFEQARQIFQEVGDEDGRSTTLNNIGFVYESVGQTRKALDYFLQALPIEQSLRLERQAAFTLINIATIHADIGETSEALSRNLEALRIVQGLRDRNSEIVILNNIGSVYDSMHNNEKALEYYQQAHALGPTGTTLNNLGAFYFKTGQVTKALESFTEALSIYRARADREGLATVLGNLAQTNRYLNKFEEAQGQFEEAIRLVEMQRTKVISQQMRASYLASMNNQYESFIDFLMMRHEKDAARGYDAAAFEISERARARSLVELLTEAHVDVLHGVDSSLIQRKRVLERRLDDKARQQMLLRQRMQAEEASVLAREIDSLTTELQQTEVAIRQKSPHYLALTQPQPLTLKQIQIQVLDDDSVLLQYSLGADKSYLWMVSSTSIASYELPGRDEIETTARRLYELLNARNKWIKEEVNAKRAARIAQSDAEIPGVAARLSQMLLRPVLKQLSNKRLLIVADGFLHYIPFAVLPAPSVGPNSSTKPLIVDHEIVNLPSVSTVAVLRREVEARKPAFKTLIALADPVFMKNDERVKRASPASVDRQNDAKNISPVGNGESLKDLELVEAVADAGMMRDGFYVPRLIDSRKEAEEIVRMVEPNKVRLALDFGANYELAASPELSHYRYVHFSTHGFLNSMHPELSGMILSLVNEKGEAQDGFLRAHEIFNLQLSADLVVLSACQTGIGNEVKGEGLLSLTRGFMYAGAPRVVVSMWSVSDSGTRELMVRFYHKMLKEGLRPAAALRSAQISLMEEKRWASAYYWAPFTLQGEWR